MGVDVARDCQGLTVHAVRFIDRRGPVFYASMPCSNETLKGCGPNGAGDKQRLVSTLWDHLVAMESPPWKRCQSFNRAAYPIKVIRGLLGRPHLLLGKYRGPAISFSEGGGRVWAALCGDESDIGIDVAGTDEFQSEYPFHRVFHPQELQHALRLAGGDLEKASAILWSIKEAVVKALGSAFHLVDPRQITVYPSAGGDGGYTFPVGLSGKALVRFPIGANRSIWVRSLPQRKMWLSIALLNGQHIEEAMGGGGVLTQVPFRGKMSIHDQRN
jgi:phosphopantetheinyl transferase (holo-ACP synthase)